LKKRSRIIASRKGIVEASREFYLFYSSSSYISICPYIFPPNAKKASSLLAIPASKKAATINIMVAAFVQVFNVIGKYA